MGGLAPESADCLRALMVASTLAVGSGANFHSTNANPTNVFTADTISSSNSKPNAAILTASNTVPGATATGTVIIKNTGAPVDAVKGRAASEAAPAGSFWRRSVQRVQRYPRADRHEAGRSTPPHWAKICQSH